MINTPLKSDREWFRSWFNDQYLQVYNHRDNAEAADFVAKWPIWDRISGEGWCLDLGCGSGRYISELTARNLKVIGLDLSLPLLQKAEVDGNPRIARRLIRADFRHLPTVFRFDLIVSLFTSFGYFDDDENQKFLKNVSDLLKSEGIYVLDLFNPDFVKSEVLKNPTSTKIKEGLKIIETRSINSLQNRVEKLIVINDGKYRNEYFESVRMYDMKELTNMLSEVGIMPFTPVWGDYKGSVFNIKSPRMVYFGVKRD